MRSKIWMCVILACSAMPSAAAGAKLAGKVLDAAALSKVRTYCVDTSNLKGPVYPGDIPRPEEFDVREVVKRESGPKGLLSKLPWKLEADCSNPGVDAIVRFEFRVFLGPWGEYVESNNPLLAEYPQPSEFVWRVELQVADKASNRAVYQAEGAPADNGLVRSTEEGPRPVDSSPEAEVRVQRYHVLRQDAAYHAFAALIADLKAISPGS